MSHNRSPIMEIYIEVRSEDIVKLQGEHGAVTMIPFGGRVDCDLFSGIVEPCGVDTQVTNQAGVRHMSARYMLTGTDCDGQACHIYVENNGWFTDGAQPRPFKTVPTFFTDSKRLAPLLHRTCFIGEGLRDDSGLWIRFYDTEESE